MWLKNEEEIQIKAASGIVRPPERCSPSILRRALATSKRKLSQVHSLLYDHIPHCQWDVDVEVRCFVHSARHCAPPSAYTAQSICSRLYHRLF